MYHYRETRDPVDLAFTDRYGGVSAVPYDELNLAPRRDDPEAVTENRRRLLADFAPGSGPEALARLSQVHGAEVALVGPDDTGDGDGFHAVGDGLATRQPGVTLMVRAADCVPVLFADPAAGVVGACHCGRPGVVAGIVPATVATLRELGAERLIAWVGPHVCGACYEVPADMQEEVAAAEPATRSTTSWGTPALDIGAGVRAQLAREGVEVVEAAACTRESPALYSHRRDGDATGRHAGLVRIRP